MDIFPFQKPLVGQLESFSEGLVADPFFLSAKEKIDAFFADESSVAQYKSVEELGGRLHEKQHAGMTLSDEEVASFEKAREELLDNPLVIAFFQAQESLQKLQKSIQSFISLTIDLGRIPSSEEIEAASQKGGCCGGSCGCGS